MTRREWLEKFLWFCDRNRPASEFARIGIRNPALKGHLAKITVYRDELKAVYAKEEAQKRKLAAIAARRRQYEESRRLAALEKAKRDSEDAKDVDGDADSREPDSEALGA